MIESSGLDHEDQIIMIRIVRMMIAIWIRTTMMMRMGGTRMLRTMRKNVNMLVAHSC